MVTVEVEQGDLRTFPNANEFQILDGALIVREGLDDVAAFSTWRCVDVQVVNDPLMPILYGGTKGV